MQFCDKNWLKLIDIKGLIAALLSYVIYQYTMEIPIEPIYVPPNDSSVHYPIVQSEVFPRRTLEFLVYFVFNCFIICIFILQHFFPRLFKKFNLMTAIWTEIVCVSAASSVTCFAKSYVGWPRPTMYTKCGYNATYETCKLQGRKRDKEFISWPSAHATLAGSAGIFMACFFQATCKSDDLLISLLSTVFLAFSVYVCGSRIKDFKHHPDDVTAGLIIGAGVSYFIWITTKKNIYTKEKEKTKFIHEERDVHPIESDEP